MLPSVCIFPARAPIRPPLVIPPCQGERRFYLGATVDDLFLATPEFLYDSALDDCQADGACEADVESRCSGSDLDALKGVQDALNLEYPGSNIVTEFAFNGAGILEKVRWSVRRLPLRHGLRYRGVFSKCPAVAGLLSAVPEARTVLGFYHISVYEGPRSFDHKGSPIQS